MKTFNQTIVNENVEIRLDKPINPKTLPSEVIKMLTDRIGDEYKAYYHYRNAANWCKDVNYKKAAAFFESEANGELGHATKLQEYLTQWNIMPSIPDAPTKASFSSLVDIINQSYVIEYDLLEKYSADAKIIFNQHQATYNFIQDYVDIQNGEVAEYCDLLNALQLINTENKFEILYFEQTYF
jgi:ferritin